jgi:acetyltransferase-like isoleucine patch superfamily enzyme
MDQKIKELHENLIELYRSLRITNKSKFNRMNPFFEDLFSWHERSEFWMGRKNNVTIYNSSLLIGDVQIGESSWIGPNSTLDGTGTISIGSFCSISTGAQLITHDTVKWALSSGMVSRETGPIRVGNCCFIGTYAVITKNVNIGNHCVVAAGSVVTKDVPDFTIVAGTPARKIGNVVLSHDGTVSLNYLTHEEC